MEASLDFCPAALKLAGIVMFEKALFVFKSK